ncbi:MAG: response regulator transcription factor [Verrucomicrobia bacterium]|nr:response regulator transcription factor [Verrucomicrobiota bacterium]
MTETQSRVLVVDDHPLFRERLVQLVENEPDLSVCGEAETAQQAIELIRTTLPQLAIVDITLRESSGLELVKSIKALSLGVPVLVLSMHDERLYAERSLRAGAAGFITKDQDAAQVIAAIRRVLGGAIYLSEQMTASVLKNLATPASKNTPRTVDRLTDRELQVLDLIGRGQTTRRIAECLRLGIATVDTYRARIKEKLDLQNGTELQHFAIRWLAERE